MNTHVYHYRLIQNGRVIDKIKIFPNCDEEEANEKWNSFMENHNYSDKVEFVKTKTQ